MREGGETSADFDRLVKQKESGVPVPDRVAVQSASKRIDDVRGDGKITTEFEKKKVRNILRDVFGIGK